MIFANQLDTVVLWLEKQQLQALGLAFEQMLAQLRTASVEQANFVSIDPGPIGPVPPSATELQVGRIAVGYDEANTNVTVFVHDVEAGEDDPPNVVIRMALQQASTMAAQIEQTVAAGRPVCPRCGQPIGPEGHVCPHDNGHFPHLIGD